MAAILAMCTLLLAAVPATVHAQSILASEAAAKSAEAKLAAAAAAATAGKQKFPVTREDLVVAMPVDQAHLTVAHASRVWRKVCFQSWHCLAHDPSLHTCAGTPVLIQMPGQVILFTCSSRSTSSSSIADGWVAALRFLSLPYGEMLLKTSNG